MRTVSEVWPLVVGGSLMLWESSGSFSQSLGVREQLHFCNGVLRFAQGSGFHRYLFPVLGDYINNGVINWRQ